MRHFLLPLLPQPFYDAKMVAPPDESYVDNDGDSGRRACGECCRSRWTYLRGGAVDEKGAIHHRSSGELRPKLTRETIDAIISEIGECRRLR